MTYRLVYSSKSRLRGSEVDVIVAIWQILKASRRKNEKGGVTGALLYHAGTFLQALEGSEDAVKQLFNRIKADERHDHVSVIYRGSVAQPLFTKWSMAGVGNSAEDQLRCIRLLGGKTFNPAIMTAEEVIEALRYLVIEKDATGSE